MPFHDLARMRAIAGMPSKEDLSVKLAQALEQTIRQFCMAHVKQADSNLLWDVVEKALADVKAKALS